MNTEANQEPQAAQTTGARLRAAREKLGLSQQAVSQRLCLKISTVRDIEDDNLPDDLASTFLRGYIRSYARLVHLSEEELLPMLAKQVPERAAKMSSVQNISLGKRRKKRDGWLMTFTWLVLFVVVGLTGAWWWQNHKAQQEEINNTVTSAAELNGVNDNARQQNVPLNNAGSLQNQASDIDTRANTSATQSSVPAAPQLPMSQTPQANSVVAPSQANIDSTVNSVPAPTATDSSAGMTLPTDQAAVTPDASTNANELTMNFTADCWLDVTDATGKKLFSGMQRKEGSLKLTGQLPYKLKIGVPSAVQIQFQGKPVDLSRFIKAGQVARLSLNGDETPAQAQ